MGQKVNPFGFRLGYNKNWQSRWYSKKEYPAFVFEDHNLRNYVKKLLYAAGLARFEIERPGDKVRLILSTARPGIVIGRKGVEIEKLRSDLRKKFGREFAIEVNEIRRPEIEAQLVAENVAQQLEKRTAFRRAMKQAIGRAMRFGAKGIKIQVGGRLNGADIARSEHYHEGTIPLQTLRADIDYGFAEADTTYGKIGIKVWVYKGEVLKGTKPVEDIPRPPRTFNRDDRRRPRGDRPQRREGGNR